MLTERGWAVLGAGGASLALWVGFGEVELLVTGVLLLLGVAVAAASSRSAAPRVGVVRRLAPEAVHEGDQATVELVVTNRRRRSLTGVVLRDSVGTLGTATFEVGRIPSAETVVARYHIVCRPRGVYDVGPAELAVTDPMGLTELGGPTGPTDRLVVYPAVEDLAGFPLVRGRDPAVHASRPEFSHRGGEDFFTLREYQTGDDLRRVHWPSSAKRDELMIRQLETPWQARALVLLDLRALAYEDEACFEKAVRGAASVFRHLAASGFDAELWAGGTATVASDHYPAAMERLAAARPLPRLDLRTVAANIGRTGRGGALFLVSGVPDPDLLGVHQLLSRDYRSTILLSATQTDSSSIISFQRAGVLTLTVRPTDSWSEAWMMATNRTWHGVSAG